MVVTKNKELAAQVRRLRMHGMEDQYYSEEHGYNSRLDEVHARILLFKLKHVENYIERRCELAKNYQRLLCRSELILPKEAKKNRHVYQLYVVRHSKRDRIIKELRKQDIHLNISYPSPIHTMRGYSFLGYKEGDLPVTETLAKEIFSLPMYPTLSEGEQEQTCKAIKDIIGRNV